MSDKSYMAKEDARGVLRDALEGYKKSAEADGMLPEDMVRELDDTMADAGFDDIEVKMV